MTFIRTDENRLPPVWVLHCRELPEREAGCRKHLDEMGIPAQWFRAMHGKTWGIATTTEYDPGKHLPPGHVALNISSYFLWQHLWLLPRNPGEREEEFIIFEDDVRLRPTFRKEYIALRRLLDQHEPDWDLVFLGLAETVPHVWGKVTERIGPPDSPLCRLNDPFGTHAILIRRRAFPVLLDNMTIAQRNLDQQLWERVLKKGLLNWCACFPSIVEQRTFDHDKKGKPEWGPSCVDLEVKEEKPAKEEPTPIPTIQPLDLADARKLVGVPHEDQYIVPPTLELLKMSDDLSDPIPCIYRGEHLEFNGRGTRHNGKHKSIPLSQCARLDVPCHTRKSDEIVGDVVFGDEETPSGTAKSCESCELRLGMASQTYRDRLPTPDGHFNPSIAMWHGRLILATRDSWGHSKLALWELKNTQGDWLGEWSVFPIGSFRSGHPDAPRLEDPRLFVAGHPGTGEPRLHASLSLPDGYPPKRVQVGYVRFDKDLTRIENTDVFRSPTGSIYEKNWVAFETDEGLNWCYQFKPDHVVMGATQNWVTPNHLPWTGGVIRGGAAPIRLTNPDGRDVYWHVYHGCLKRLIGNIYTAGVLEFDAKPPFQVLRQTPSPLIWPDLPAIGESPVKRYVCWPGGAVIHKDRLFVVLGVDDTFCRMRSFPVSEIHALMTDTPETVWQKTFSIRDTSIASGIKETVG